MNNQKKTYAALLATALGLGVITPANAQSTYVSEYFTGVFDAGAVDTYGYLTGVNGYNLSGLSFSATIGFYDTTFTVFQPTYYFTGSTAYATVSVTGRTLSDGGGDVNWQSIQSYNTTASELTLFATDATNPSPSKIKYTMYSSLPFAAQGISTQAGLDAYFQAAVNYSSANQLWIHNNWGAEDSINYTITSAAAVPEPTSMALLLAGVSGLVIARRRR